MNNNEFLNAITEMYQIYFLSNKSSNKKLYPVHGKIAEDLQNRLGDGYVVYSLGFGNGKEKEITGRYMDKKVDISVFKKSNGQLVEIGGIAVKSIMTNYAQNSNNYFENMLGETANLRSANKLYFQLLIIPEILPYIGDKKVNGIDYKDRVIKNEHLNEEKLNKYLKLSNDNISEFMHTPNKTLLCIIKTVDTPINIPINIEDRPTREDWIDYMQQNLNIEINQNNYNFGSAIINNNYEEFITKVVHAVLAV